MNSRYYYIVILIASIFITSCGSSSNVSTYHKKSNFHKKATAHSSASNYYRSSNSEISSKDSKYLLQIAKSFIGTPYKYGGSNSLGFDCSGLVMISFDELGLKLPRNSAQQAEKGKEIKITDVKEGDLVFFNTSGSTISHVGIVESIDKIGQIKFIHSSTSKGVIISSLDENYWKTRFVKAVRLL